jgi:MFS family permease
MTENHPQEIDAAAGPVPALASAAVPWTPERRYVTASLMLVMVLASMEQTITSTVMPTIIADVHGLEHYSWVASIYLLACTVTMPLYGRLADAIGRKRVILSAIAIFALASVAASFARTMPQLIVCRGLQGLGAGGIMPVTLTILGDLFTLKERAQIQGCFSAVWGTASLAGPALGAGLVKTLGWRSVFYVNLPLAIGAATVLAWKYHEKSQPHKTDLDLPGVGLLAAGCAALLLLVSGVGGASWWWMPVLAAAAAGSLLLFARQERHTTRPILDPALMFSRAIWPHMVASFLLGAGFLCLDNYVPPYVQYGRGGGLGATVGVVTPVMLTWALSSLMAAPLLVRWGFRRTAMLGAMLVVAGFVGLLICALVSAPHLVITAVLALIGLGLGPSAISALLGAQSAATWEQRGVVTSGITFCRTVGGALGIGALWTMFNAINYRQMAHLRAVGIDPAILLDPVRARAAVSPQIADEIRLMFTSGLTWVFAAMLLFAVAQVAVAACIRRDDGGKAPDAAAIRKAAADLAG